MNTWKRLHPERLLQTLHEIDAKYPSHRLNRDQALLRVVSTLAWVCVCLLVLHYAKFPSVWNGVLFVAAKFSGFPEHAYFMHLERNEWLLLSEYFWWGFCHFFAFFLLPCMWIRYVFKERIADYGLRWNGVSQHRFWYGALLALIVLFVLLVSLGQDFVNHYPFYRLSRRSWLDWAAWELIYISQFVFLEFFFRGFLLQALRPAMGAQSILVMCIPYMMIHLPKLPLEAFGAVLFGLFLGMLALLSRSIWGGVLVHVGVALSMDAAALWRQQALPQQWWPY
jgi:membrane protease YdiL (CAAX protease family)